MAQFESSARLLTEPAESSVVAPKTWFDIVMLKVAC